MVAVAPLAPGEAAQATLLWRDAGLLRPWNQPEADIAAALANATSTILAIRDGDHVIGTVMVGYDGHRGWLYYVAVAPDHRGSGLGGMLVAAAEAWLGERGASVVRLMVRAENDAVTGFYRALGYEAGDFVVMGKRIAG